MWAIAFALLASSPGAAPQLRVDGVTSAVVELGGATTISVAGAPGAEATLFLDVFPGPTVVLGQTVPLGFTAATIVVALGTLSPSGSLSVRAAVPRATPVHGTTVHVWAVVTDPAAPFGLAFTNGADLTLVARPVELAGHTLSRFPFFDVVRAVPCGAAVQLALDPGRLPALGRSADLYVVAAKGPAQWAANPSLVDVAGGPRTVTFAGSTIQANTFPLAAGSLPGPDETPGSRDVRVGVPYDVIIDFGRDGTYDERVDLIDGHGAEAGFYVVRDTTVGSLGPGGTAAGGLSIGPGTGGGGPYAVTEILYDLNGSWTPVAGSPTTMLKQDTYYPTDIASMGRLPLVVISHGNRHDYQWYDHLGYHLASYGYVVMSHTNNTGPGTHTAAETTIDNTDAMLGNLKAIGGGVLDDHVDGSKIVWIGHSRGGDGVVRAYDLMVDGRTIPSFQPPVTPRTFTRRDVVLISSIAPVDFGGSENSNPHDANFHLWVGQADSDVHGCVSSLGKQWYPLYERATGNRQSISLYGCGHTWFHNGVDEIWASGPCLIGREKTHLVMKGFALPLLKYHTEGDVAAKDFLWRQYKSFRPVGVPIDPCVTCNLMFQERGAGTVVLDDFQSNGAGALASSGAAVTMTVPGYAEGKMEDANSDFSHVPTDTWNGFLMDTSSFWAYANDDSRGAVFDVDGVDRHLTYHLLPSQRNLESFEFLQFRAAQGTRHPLTIAELADFTFSVSLVDRNGAASSIDIGAFGGGIEEPYQRNSGPVCGVGVGWNSEFETVRLRLDDFTNNGNGLDLGDIRHIAFQFGPSWGSARVRLGLDEIAHW